MAKIGKIYLIPCPISDGKIESLSSETIRVLHHTLHFLVERAKTARHFIKASNHPVPIANLNIQEIKHKSEENEVFLKSVFDGWDIGVISEAGCPGIADPGAEIVAWAHKNNVQIVPLVGPSSIFLALMSSGLNGQNFAFNGYLSNKIPELTQQLKILETKIQKSGQTQIFMETPYRNAFIIEHCIQSLQPNTKLCVACDLNTPTEDIKQMHIKNWKNIKLDHYHKRPCIFLIGI